MSEKTPQELARELLAVWCDDGSVLGEMGLALARSVLQERGRIYSRAVWDKFLGSEKARHKAASDDAMWAYLNGDSSYQTTSQKANGRDAWRAGVAWAMSPQSGTDSSDVRDVSPPQQVPALDCQWERIDGREQSPTWRTRTPDGWLVMTWDGGLAYVPDADGKWLTPPVEKEEQR